MNKYSEKDMAKLISEVENEFKDYLTKAESQEKDLKKSEKVITKSENDFDYDEEDIKEMNEMYASMSKSEAEAHFESLKKALSSEESIKKSEKNVVSEENGLVKSELNTIKQENQELKKSIETLTNIVSKIVKPAPKRKAITQMSDIEYIKKSEEVVEKKEEKTDYSKMSKSEINKILSSKIRNGEIKKSEDKQNINKFCFGELNLDGIKYLL